MAVIFKRFRMLHFPRTGGKWRIGVCKSHKIPHALWTPKHSLPSEVGAQGLPTAVFIREPISWYRSYFAYKMTIGCWGSKAGALQDFDREVHAETFERFMENVLSKRSGFCSNLMNQFIAGSQYILPFEEMSKWFKWLLNTHSDKNDPHIPSLEGVGSMNGSYYHRCDMECDKSLIDDVSRSELDYRSNLTIIK